jgi:hypothetical protein
VLTKPLASCRTDNVRDLRDRAILMVALPPATEGEAKSPVYARKQLTFEPPIPVKGSPPFPLSPSISAGPKRQGPSTTRSFI